MKEIPILFSGPMVRALLEGRKTQTRRIAKQQPARVEDIDSREATKRYGQPGDLLWVRETWQRVSLARTGDAWTERAMAEGRYAEDPDGNPGLMCWKADGDQVGAPWKPSIHMPKWAARIWLEVTGVRVERLQDISGNDAVAEGVEEAAGPDVPLFRDYFTEPMERGRPDIAEWFGDPRDSFQSLWRFINGAESWDANPWVWVVEFKRSERRAEAA